MTQNVYYPRGLLLENSYVLQLQITPYSLELQMEFVLLPEHSEYVSPKFGESASFRSGSLKITGFKDLHWEATGYPPGSDATGEMDWGCLDVFGHQDNCWTLVGSWGTFRLTGGQLDIHLGQAEHGTS
jgi:hypothetical protein